MVQIIYWGILETRRDRPWEHKRDVPILFQSLFQKRLFLENSARKILKSISTFFFLSRFSPLYHFHPLANIETFICNFACEMTMTYFQSQRWDLPPYRITFWVTDWGCNVCLFTWWCSFTTTLVLQGEVVSRI